MGGWIASTLVKLGDLKLEFLPPDPEDDDLRLEARRACPTSCCTRWPTASPPSPSTGPRPATPCRPRSAAGCPEAAAAGRRRRRRRRHHPHRRRPAFCAGLDLKELGRRRGRASAPAVGGDDAPAGAGPFPDARQAGHRRHQRRRRHRRVRGRPQLRLPRRLRAGPLRRHPRPRRRAAGLGPHRAARRRPSASRRARELSRHRQLPRRRDGAGVGAREPRRPPRRAAAVHRAALAADIVSNDQAGVRRITRTYAEGALAHRRARRGGTSCA